MITSLFLCQISKRLGCFRSLLFYLHTYPFSHAGVFGSRTVRAPEPPSGHCSSPPGPPGSPPGSSEPHERPPQSSSSDGGVKTPIFHSAALQPGVARKARICHTKTLNIDLICSDGAQRALELSTHIAEGAVLGVSLCRGRFSGLSDGGLQSLQDR